MNVFLIDCNWDNIEINQRTYGMTLISGELELDRGSDEDKHLLIDVHCTGGGQLNSLWVNKYCKKLKELKV